MDAQSRIEEDYKKIKEALVTLGRNAQVGKGGDVVITNCNAWEILKSIAENTDDLMDEVQYNFF